MPWNDGLTGTALAIAGYEGTPLHVLAGPGTGKTFSLMRRVARYIERGTPPSRILAVTFTRIAANDLLINLHRLGIEGCEEVKAMTLHALCFHILSTNEVLQITGRTPRPLLKHEIDCLLYDMSDRYGDKQTKQKLVDAFTAAWARLQTDEPGWPPNPDARDFQNDLLAWLRFHKAMLIGELVPLTLSYLRNNPACPERNLFNVVLADEYQDLNKAEQRLIDMFSAIGQLTVVGDDDQSIYQFKYAHPEGMIQFPNEHPDTRQETLDECSRCPIRVVEIADSLITNNTNRIQRHLMPRNGNPLGTVHIVQWNDLEEEAQGVSSLVRYCLQNLGIPEKEVLVLSPRRLLGYKIRDYVREAGIRVRSCFSEDALEGERAKRQFVLLNLLAYRNDLPALRSWLGLGTQGKRSNAYSRLRTYCDRNATSPFDALSQLARGQITIPYVVQLVEKWRELQLELAPLIGRPTPDIVNALLPDGYNEVEELRSIALSILNDTNDIVRLFDSTRSQIAHPELPKVEDSVRVMSLHKSKGLTARAVIVGGCIEGWLPQIKEDTSRTEQHRQLEEARRLFFVAVTRTTEVLVISSSIFIDYATAGRTGARTTRAGRRARTISSRFLQELGPAAPNSITGADLLGQLVNR